jgi:hypothetical protein
VINDYTHDEIHWKLTWTTSLYQSHLEIVTVYEQTARRKSVYVFVIWILGRAKDLTMNWLMFN